MMRALSYWVSVAITLAAGSAFAGDVRQFEIQNLRLGMTVSEVKETGKKIGLGEFGEIRSPSFEQSVALSRRKSVSPGSYNGVQTMQAKSGAGSVRIGLVQTPSGSRVARISYSFLDTSLNDEKLRADIVQRYGQPEARRDLEWLWGDTATFFDARTKPYLELRLNPATPGVEKPIAILTLADPTMERDTREAIQKAAQK